MESLKLHKLSKYFGGVVASENVDMEVPKGKITGLIGPNGAGKTTIVNMITGMLSVSSGSIVLGDQDITQSPAHSICRFGLARTFQNIRLLSEATVLENVMMSVKLAGLPFGIYEERALSLLKDMGVERKSQQIPSKLSGGERQRVAIARALVNRPRVILADEPTGNLDERTGGEVMELLLHSCWKEQSSLVLVTHNPNFAKATNMVSVLKDGNLMYV